MSDNIKAYRVTMTIEVVKIVHAANRDEAIFAFGEESYPEDLDFVEPKYTVTRAKAPCAGAGMIVRGWHADAKRGEGTRLVARCPVCEKITDANDAGRRHTWQGVRVEPHDALVDDRVKHAKHFMWEADYQQLRMAEKNPAYASVHMAWHTSQDC